MKKLLFVPLALALVATPAAVFGQNNAPSPAVPPAAAEEAQAGLSMDMVVGAVREETITADRLAAETANVKVVKVSAVQGGITGADIDDLKAALDEGQDQLSKLREAITANADLSKLVTDAGATVEDVVAVVIEEQAGTFIVVDDGQLATAGESN